jgi:hypothetical protein
LSESVPAEDDGDAEWLIDRTVGNLYKPPILEYRRRQAHAAR